MAVADDGHARRDGLLQLREGGGDEAGADAVVIGAHAMFGDEDGDAGRFMGVADGPGEGGGIDFRTGIVELRALGRGKLALVAPHIAFVILDAEEVVGSRGFQPCAVELPPLGIAEAVAADGLVIEHGEGEADG